MDEQINDKIQKVLSDPESLKTIMSIASAFGGKSAPQSTPAVSDFTHEDINENDAEASEALNAVQAFSAQRQQSMSADDRVNLLLSIKPFLNNRKQQRVDSLVKALGAARLISAYKDTDLLGNLGLK